MSEKAVVLQVRNIFQLYADIEHTSRNNAFYEKYNLRYSMGDLLRERLLLCTLAHVDQYNAGKGTFIGLMQCSITL